jgi:hypothetical protein
VDGLSRLWRRALVGWAVAVAVGGGLTLWLQDSGTSHPPGETRTPLSRQDGESACPMPTDSRRDDHRVLVVCVRGG